MTTMAASFLIKEKPRTSRSEKQDKTICVICVICERKEMRRECFLGFSFIDIKACNAVGGVDE